MFILVPFNGAQVDGSDTSQADSKSNAGGTFLNGVYQPAATSNRIAPLPTSKNPGEGNLKQTFQKISIASSSIPASLISDPLFSAPIISSSPLPLNLFAATNKHHSSYDEDVHKDLQPAESGNVYAPYVKEQSEPSKISELQNLVHQKGER